MRDREDGLKTAVYHVHDLRPAVLHKPPHSRIHLRLQMPVKQARQVSQTEVHRGRVEKLEKLLRKLPLLGIELRSPKLHRELVPSLVVVVEPEKSLPWRESW